MRRKKHIIKRPNRVRIVGSIFAISLITCISATWALQTIASSGCNDAAPCINDNTPASGTPWTLAFGDEFNSNNLDTQSWSSGRFNNTTDFEAPYNLGKEGAYFSSSNVSVGGGIASIHLQRSSRTINGVTYRYSSGEINSRNKVSMHPGEYLEARIKVPKCSGCWPAFWTLPSQQIPPEYDIFEFFNTLIRDQPSFNYHRVGGGETGPTIYGDPGTDYRNNFHIYGLYWTNDAAIPYIDGKPYPVGVAATNNLQTYLIFNLSTYAGTAPGNSTMDIDWVRLWEPSEPSPTPQPSPNSQIITQLSTTPTPKPAAVPSATNHPLPITNTSAPVVAGQYQIQTPGSAQKVSVKVDGTPANDSQHVDTRLLTNGEHVLSIQATTSNGKQSTQLQTIFVNNQLSLPESARNTIFAGFHGNLLLMYSTTLIWMGVLVTGVVTARWLLRPRPRTQAVGLSI